MDTTSKETVIPNIAPELMASIQRNLGQYRAEYLHDRVFELFSQPVYWNRLADTRPCIIEGGRGTGKTTTLRQLAYKGQFQIHGSDIRDWGTLAMYWRVETNVISAFRGSRFTEHEWSKLFGHYINLQFVYCINEFIKWRQENLGQETTINNNYLRRTCLSFGMNEATNLDDFANSIEDQLYVFENYINGFDIPPEGIRSSIPGKPIELLSRAILSDETVPHNSITFCIDEYESLEPYQQRVLNTLIKHVGDTGYTFKIGMRPGGLHERATLSPTEFLIEPADFVRINIEEEIRRDGFPAFAEEVCNDRIRSIRKETGVQIPLVTDLLPDLSLESEAELLGGKAYREKTRTKLVEDSSTAQVLEFFDDLPLVDACVVGFIAQSEDRSAHEVTQAAINDLRSWKFKVGNYSYAMLFVLRQKKRGLSKYYSGWSVYVQLADGNVRYLLYLVTEALSRHIESSGKATVAISAEMQTMAAQSIGERVVFELAGLHRLGTQLARLALGLGRIFGLMASQPHGHAPEVTQFRIPDLSASAEVQELISAAVMHNAITKFTADKMAAYSPETKDYDYQLHPIVAPFFQYSYRRKRRMSIKSGEVLGISSFESTKFIRSYLSQTKRTVDIEPSTQPTLFSEYFNE